MTEPFTDWSEIDWIYVNDQVKRLRRRIFQAKLENNYRKLRNLQRLMLKSSANILFSIKAITSNSGKKSCGIDGITVRTSKEKLNLFYDIKRNKYFGKEPMPTRRIYIKEPTKLRPIGIPTVYDRVIQTMVKNSLEPEWEAIFEKGSYGFRPKRTIDDAVQKIWTSLNRPTSRKWVIDTDISKCFDSISHSYMLQKVRGFPAVHLIKKWLKVGIIINGIWLDSGEEGTPQGSAISPLLCNISLHGLEKELGVIYLKSGYVSRKGPSIIRFADDLVILTDSKQDAFRILEDLKQALIIRGLTISETKTKIVHVMEGFDFLGFNFKLKPKRHVSWKQCVSIDPISDNRINQKLMGLYVAPSAKSIKKIKTKMKETSIKWSSNMTKIFIRKMNELIRGFAQSKWHWHSSQAFSTLNNYLYHLSWRWALRRHPKKLKGWIKNKYFGDANIGNIKEKWVFQAKVVNRSVEKYDSMFLYKFHWFRIKDHIMCKMDKLPDNKLDVKYFEDLRIKRGRSRPFNILFKIDKDLSDSQFHLCPICNEDLFNGNKLHMHHIIPISENGKSTFENLVIIHEDCHSIIHNQTNMIKYRNYLLHYKKGHSRITNKD